MTKSEFREHGLAEWLENDILDQWWNEMHTHQSRSLLPAILWEQLRGYLDEIPTGLWDDDDKPIEVDELNGLFSDFWARSLDVPKMRTTDRKTVIKEL